MADIGDQGPQGVQGGPGVQGIQGIRGPGGARGDMGASTTGAAGATGATGAQGPRGISSATPRWYSLTDRRLLIIFVLLVLAGVFALSSYQHQNSQIRKAQIRIEQAQQKINRNSSQIRDGAYQSCLGGVKILSEFNKNQDVFLKLIQGRNDIPADVKKQYIDAYQKAKVLPLPTCIRAKNVVR